MKRKLGSGEAVDLVRGAMRQDMAFNKGRRADDDATGRGHPGEHLQHSLPTSEFQMLMATVKKTYAIGDKWLCPGCRREHTVQAQALYPATTHHSCNCGQVTAWREGQITNVDQVAPGKGKQRR